MREAFWDRLRACGVLVVGLSPKTGIPAARLLGRFGVPYAVSDAAPPEEVARRVAGLPVAPTAVHAGEQRPRQLEGFGEILVAPGVPRTIPLLQVAAERGIPVRSDIDFFAPLLDDKTVVAITGTDGKTTTTELCGVLLGTLGATVVAGNGGTSPLAVYDAIEHARYVALEASSFMLEDTTRFRADVSTILNLAEDHLERHGTMEAYRAAKRNVVRHARPGDTFLRQVDEPWLEDGWSPGAEVEQQLLSCRRRDVDRWYGHGAFHHPEGPIPRGLSPLEGQQHEANILTATTVALLLGAEPSEVGEALATFEGLPHRMQRVAHERGVLAYDDSKASNIHAVGAALQNFDEGVVLILGGRGKGLDVTPLKRHLHRLRWLVAYGEDGQQMRATLGAESSSYVYAFDEAVWEAARRCESGDVLLLSPGCTSWDQHRNYLERGDQFAELVATALRETGC